MFRGWTPQTCFKIFYLFFLFLFLYLFINESLWFSLNQAVTAKRENKLEENCYKNNKIIIIKGMISSEMVIRMIIVYDTNKIIKILINKI